MDLKLAICCVGLEITSSSPFHSSTLMGRMTGPATAKNEKRKIKLQCSDEFKPGGRPTSLLYDTFFESVVFDDISSLRSPFLASLKCSADLDRKIRINVYYTSNLSGGKETIIAATTFGLREMLRPGKSSFQTDMISEHCSSPKAIISVVSIPSNPFSQAFFSLSFAKEKNPLVQQYVFYRNDELLPTVVCDEITYEPAYPVQVPLAFLRNFTGGLQKSILAWEDRCKLERIRQGLFVSVAEAHAHGWHQLRVTVLGSRIKSQCDALSKVTSVLLHTEERGIDNTDVVTVSAPSVVTTPPQSRQASTGAVSVRSSSVSDEGKTKGVCNTYVEVFLENEGDAFDQHIGRTNTEFSSLEPTYGSSIPKTGMPKSQKGGEFIGYGSTEIVSQSVWGAAVDLGLAGFEGRVYHMMTFVPEATSNKVRLDLFQEEDTSGKSIRMGSCWVPLEPNCRRDIWVPVSMVHSYAFSEAELRLQIEVLSSIDTKNPDYCQNESSLVSGFCSSMPVAYIPVSDSQFLQDETTSTAPSKLKVGLNRLFSAADACGDDIQVDGKQVWSHARPSGDSDDEDETELNKANVPSANVYAPSVGSTDDVKTLDSASVIRDCYRWMWDLGYTGCDPLLFPAGTKSATESDGRSRADFPYELSWIAGHIKDLKDMNRTVQSLIDEYESMARRGVTLRKSPLKENLEMQCLPLNLHFQFMVSRRHNAKSDLAEISDFTTCGSMSAHGLGYKNGGLEYQEDTLGREKAAIESMVVQYQTQISGRSHLHPSFPANALFHKLGSRVQAFESETVRVGLRRLFCLSQILSIAINTLLLKLNLVALGYIDAFFADRWIDQGFPLIFESLLSVSGKERVMLEDTSRAIEVLRMYRVRIIGVKSSILESEEDFASPKINVQNREVILQFSDAFLRRLPSRFASAGVSTGQGRGIIISLVSFLFTLGIDIKQAMATTWENTDGNLDFQVGINKRGFTLLNEYCHKVMPVDQFADLLHPFVSDFEATLRNPSKMNVDILHEVEKISVMLGGCRVTFCKSGKDRTGMAVTLDQSRQLSEIFGLESSIDRVIRDANLMRVYGTRLMVAEKNIGRAVFAINRLQLQFMPAVYRPPLSVLEDVFKASDSS